MAIGINSSSGNSTGYTTGNPQTTGQDTIGGGLQNPQSVPSASSINDQSSGATIPLQPGSVTASSLQPTSTSSHQVSIAAIIPLTALVILAVILCIYIYVSSKSKKLLANT